MKFRKLMLIGAAGWLALAGTSHADNDGRIGRPGLNTNYNTPSGNGLDNPDWAEEEIPSPPEYSKDHLIAIDMPPYVAVKVGVDPDTIRVGSDGVVRYVIVMRNASGNTNAVFEGIRCVSDEVKTYARQNSSGEWSVVKNPQWKAVNDNMPSRHAQAFARQGGCQNRLATSKEEIIKVLKSASRPTQGKKSD